MWNWRPTNWSVTLILVLAVWWLPWWLFLFLFCAATLLRPHFYQAFIPALLFDLSYVANDVAPWKLSLPVTLLAVILLWLGGKLQSELRL